MFNNTILNIPVTTYNFIVILLNFKFNNYERNIIQIGRY